MDLSKTAIFFCSGDCSNNMYFRGLYLSDIGQVYLALVIIDKTLFGCGLLLIYNTLALHVQWLLTLLALTISKRQEWWSSWSYLFEAWFDVSHICSWNGWALPYSCYWMSLFFLNLILWVSQTLIILIYFLYSLLSFYSILCLWCVKFADNNFIFLLLWLYLLHLV